MTDSTQTELQTYKAEILAAIAESREQIVAQVTESRILASAELRKEASAIRLEISGIRRAIEILAVTLLSPQEEELQKVRKSMAVG